MFFSLFFFSVETENGRLPLLVTFSFSPLPPLCISWTDTCLLSEFPEFYESQLTSVSELLATTSSYYGAKVLGLYALVQV